METLTFPVALLPCHLATTLNHVAVLRSFYIEQSVGRLLIEEVTLLPMVIGGYLHSHICWLRLLLYSFDSI